MKFYEHNKRSLVKTITYESIKLISGTTIVFFFTKTVEVTVQILLTSVIAGTFLYFIHERVWNSISWGKGKNP